MQSVIILLSKNGVQKPVDQVLFQDPYDQQPETHYISQEGRWQMLRDGSFVAPDGGRGWRQVFA